MANIRKPKGDNKNIARNIQKQYENLFSKQDEPPALSLREVEALKGRVAELEATLAQHELTSFEPQASPNGKNPPQQSEAFGTMRQDIENAEKTNLKPGSIPRPPLKSEQEKPSFLRALLRAPTFGDAAKNRIASLQHKIIIGLLVTGILAFAAILLTFNAQSIPGLAIIGFEIFLFVSAIYLQRRDHLQVVSWMLVGVIYAALISSLFTTTTGFDLTSVLELALVVTLAGLLLRPLPVVVVTILAIITLVVGPNVGKVASIDPTQVIFTALILGIEGALLTLASSTFEQAFVEVKASTNALLYTNKELQDLTSNLEQRVANRTHELELASQVGQSITERIGDLSDLLSQAVELIRVKFELYYTQVYLTDTTGRSIVLRAGAGEVGEKLLQRGHRLLIGSGSLNGRAAAEKKAVVVADTAKSGTFLRNPLLPNTRSEMAVPLIISGRVLGVLDMQSETPDALNQLNLLAFEVLAGQLAIAIQNATLFEQAEESRLEVEAHARRLTTSGWQQFLNAVERSEKIGYVYSRNEVLPWVETEAIALDNSLVVPIEITGANVGEIRLLDEANREWTEAETEIVRATVVQVAQQIENLRLLSEAERYRTEAEQVSRRLTIEGWNEYLKTRHQLASGYVYDQNQVQPFSGNGHSPSAPGMSRPLMVREETIGEITVDADGNNDAHAADIMSTVAEQLSEHIENLRLLEETEQKLQEAQSLRAELTQRANQLETVAVVSTTASTVLDPDKLLQAIVDLTKERFGLYHAHIYLADDAWQMLLLASGAGEIGRQLVAEEHAIAINAEQSLVARAVREQKAIIINDVRNEPSFLPNPLLPDTRSEMAVPMIAGDKVLGVFDVQSDHLDGFSKEDADIYATLAAQAAVALQNARLYVEQAATLTQLRELDRLKSSFLANMSHELRTPLNSILGFADVMLEGLDGPLTENMDNDLGLIHKNGQHLLHLINDVLDMAKIEAGRMNFHTEKFKVHEIIDEVTNLTSTFASEKSLSLFIEEGSDENLEIFADRTRIRQVLINLVNNAIKFTEKGKIAINTLHKDGRVLISVRDTGVGIPADKLEAVFQEFTQVDTSSTRRAGGTGLGLPISRRLVEMHGGRLWAESSGIDGEGTTFYVDLPLEAVIIDAEPLEK